MENGNTTFVAGDLVNVEALYTASKLSEYLGSAKILGDLDTTCPLNERSFTLAMEKLKI